MAERAFRPCRHPGCAALTQDGWCPKHKPVGDHRRRASADWRWMYRTPVWKRRRAHQLTVEPFCRECAKQGLRVWATDADHIEPHRGDWDKFVNGDLQSLCHACHARKTLEEMRDRGEISS